MGALRMGAELLGMVFSNFQTILVSFRLKQARTVAICRSYTSFGLGLTPRPQAQHLPSVKFGAGRVQTLHHMSKFVTGQAMCSNSRQQMYIVIILDMEGLGGGHYEIYLGKYGPGISDTELRLQPTPLGVSNPGIDYQSRPPGGVDVRNRFAESIPRGLNIANRFATPPPFLCNLGFRRAEIANRFAMSNPRGLDSANRLRTSTPPGAGCRDDPTPRPPTSAPTHSAIGYCLDYMHVLITPHTLAKLRTDTTEHISSQTTSKHIRKHMFMKSTLLNPTRQHPYRNTTMHSCCLTHLYNALNTLL